MSIRSKSLGNNTRPEVPSPTDFRKLFEKTRPYASENVARSWFHLLSTMALTAAFLWLAGQNHLPLTARFAGTLLSALTMVRLFILFHDFEHGAIFVESRFAKVVMSLVGCFLLRSPYDWRRSHNFHHQQNTVFKTASVGSFPIMTVQQYKDASPGKQLQYRIIRNSLVIVFGYVTCFVVEAFKKLFFKDSQLKLQSACAILVHGAYIAFCFSKGWSTGLLAGVLPHFVSCMVGVYLFYVQHNFEGAHFLPDEEWDYGFAALHSSSFVRGGPFFRFFSGNIGFHHIHHLNHKIPFYRLPEAMKGIPELQSPVTLTLTPALVWRYLGLKLWCEETQSFTGYPVEVPRRTRGIRTETVRSQRSPLNPKEAESSL